MALYNLCNGCGCRINSRDTYCDKCLIEKKKYKVRVSKQYNTRRKELDSTYGLYNTLRWSKLRKYIMSECNWLCLWSYYVEGKIVQAKICHHIEEANEDNFFDKDNLIPLSHEAHEYIHSIYNEDVKEQLRIMKDKARNDFK